MSGLRSTAETVYESLVADGGQILDLTKSEGNSSATLSSEDVIVFPRSSPGIERAVKAVQTLRAMPDGWDAHNSRRIQTAAIANTLRLIQSLVWLDFPTPHVAPVPGGGLQVEWQVGRRGLEIAIHADGGMDYLGIEDDDYDHALEGDMPPNDTAALKKMARWLLQPVSGM